MAILSGTFKHTIDTIYSVTIDGYGDSTRTSEYTDVPCRFQKIQQRIVTESHEEVLSNAKVWIPAEYSDIKRNWEIVVNSKTYMIVHIDFQYTLMCNLDHIKLFLV